MIGQRDDALVCVLGQLPAGEMVDIEGRHPAHHEDEDHQEDQGQGGEQGNPSVNFPFGQALPGELGVAENAAGDAGGQESPDHLDRDAGPEEKSLGIEQGGREIRDAGDDQSRGSRIERHARCRGNQRGSCFYLLRSRIPQEGCGPPEPAAESEKIPGGRGQAVPARQPVAGGGQEQGGSDDPSSRCGVSQTGVSGPAEFH